MISLTAFEWSKVLMRYKANLNLTEPETTSLLYVLVFYSTLQEERGPAISYSVAVPLAPGGKGGCLDHQNPGPSSTVVFCLPSCSRSCFGSSRFLCLGSSAAFSSNFGPSSAASYSMSMTC